MAKGSKGRGIRGELEARDLINIAGFQARRGQQYEGSSDSPDIVVPELKDICHIEVKCVGGFLSKKMKDAYLKAQDECSSPQTPVLIHRYLAKPAKSQEERKLAKRWLVTVDARFFFRMLRLSL